jgi:hypothetical protein
MSDKSELAARVSALEKEQNRLRDRTDEHTAKLGVLPFIQKSLEEHEKEDMQRFHELQGDVSEVKGVAIRIESKLGDLVSRVDELKEKGEDTDHGQNAMMRAQLETQLKAKDEEIKKAREEADFKRKIFWGAIVSLVLLFIGYVLKTGIPGHH